MTSDPEHPRSSATSDEPRSIASFRADLFALPTETRGRFYLLMVTVLLLAWNLPYAWIEVPEWFPATETTPAAEPGPGTTVPIEIQNLVPRVVRAGRLETLTVEERHRFLAFMKSHSESIFGAETIFHRIAAPLAVVGFLVPVAIFLAWFRRRMDGAEWLANDAAPRVHAEIEHLADRLALIPRPRLAIRPGFLDGRATHDGGGPRVDLSGSPRWLDATWNDLGRAVLLHELGHVVNKDFRIREIVRWFYIVFFALFAVNLIALVVAGRGSQGLESLAQTVSILGVAWILWAGMVRDRELYADQRVVAWGYGPALGRRLALPSSLGVNTPSNDEAVPRWRRVVRSWLARKHHPSNAERVEALSATRRFFSLSLGFTASTGLLLATPIATFGFFARDLVTASAIPMIPILATLPTRGLLLPMIVALFLTFSIVLAVGAAVIVRSLGLQVLREGLIDRLEGRAAALALGKLTGLSAVFLLAFELGLLIWSGPPASRFILPTLAISFLAFWIWLVQLYAAGRWALGACSGPTPPRRLIRFVTVMGAMQWIALAWTMTGLRGLVYVSGSPDLPQHLPLGTAASLATALLGFFIAFGVGAALVFWAITILLIESRPTPCRACGHVPSTRPGIEDLCLACDTPRAGWLFPRRFDLWLGFRAVGR